MSFFSPCCCSDLLPLSSSSSSSWSCLPPRVFLGLLLLPLLLQLHFFYISSTNDYSASPLYFRLNKLSKSMLVCGGTAATIHFGDLSRMCVTGVQSKRQYSIPFSGWLSVIKVIRRMQFSSHVINRSRYQCVSFSRSLVFLPLRPSLSQFLSLSVYCIVIKALSGSLAGISVLAQILQ